MAQVSSVAVDGDASRCSPRSHRSSPDRLERGDPREERGDARSGARADQWAFFQAKGVKSAIAANGAELVADGKAELAAKLVADAKRYKDEADAIQAKAEGFEKKVEESNARSEDLMEHHHRFAIAVTMLQISIALAAIASAHAQEAAVVRRLDRERRRVLMFLRGFF